MKKITEAQKTEIMLILSCKVLNNIGDSTTVSIIRRILFAEIKDWEFVKSTIIAFMPELTEEFSHI